MTKNRLLFPISSFIVFVLISFGALSCSSKSEKGTDDLSKDAEDCNYMAPVAIFKIISSELAAYKFEKASAYNTIESFSFSATDRLEVHQKGCDRLVQEFRFFTNSSLDRMDYVIAFFTDISKKDPSLLGLEQFASEFNRRKEELAVGNTLQLSETIFIKIDETPMGASERLIRITMSSDNF